MNEEPECLPGRKHEWWPHDSTSRRCRICNKVLPYAYQVQDDEKLQMDQPKSAKVIDGQEDRRDTG